MTIFGSREALLEHYKRLEHLFAILFAEPSSQFLREDHEVKEYLVHAEYGLALEVFVESIIHEKREIPRRSFETVVSLATAMEITNRLDLAALEKLIQG